MRDIISQTYFIDELGPELEENYDDILVDETGYIPPEKLIKNLLSAGNLLQYQRSLEAAYEYDGDVDIDDVEINPTTRKSFDIVDAQIISDALQAKYDKARAEKLEEEKLQEKQVLIQKDAEPAEAATE